MCYAIIKSSYFEEIVKNSFHLEKCPLKRKINIFELIKKYETRKELFNELKDLYNLYDPRPLEFTILIDPEHAKDNIDFEFDNSQN